MFGKILNVWEITIIQFAATIIDAETDGTFNFMEMETVMESKFHISKHIEASLTNDASNNMAMIANCRQNQECLVTIQQRHAKTVNEG